MKDTREGFINKSVSGSTCVGGWDTEAEWAFPSVNHPLWSLCLDMQTEHV